MYRKAILNRKWTNLRGSPSNGPKTTSVNQQGGELVTLESLRGPRKIATSADLCESELWQQDSRVGTMGQFGRARPTRAPAGTKHCILTTNYEPKSRSRTHRRSIRRKNCHCSRCP